MSLEQGTASFFCKGLTVNILVFASPVASIALLNPAIVAESHTQETYT